MDERLRHIRFHIEGHLSLCALIDRQRMKGALLNLVVNAIQAMPHGGTVTLSAFARPGEVAIRVSDTGVGIPPENLPKIFSPFFTTKIRGNGFGLAEVYKTVQAHGGSIEVSSIVGKGSAFTIRLR
jgi:signal transduction histidine kinase